MTTSTRSYLAIHQRNKTCRKLMHFGRAEIQHFTERLDQSVTRRWSHQKDRGSCQFEDAACVKNPLCSLVLKYSKGIWKATPRKSGWITLHLFKDRKQNDPFQDMPQYMWLISAESQDPADLWKHHPREKVLFFGIKGIQHQTEEPDRL